MQVEIRGKGLRVTDVLSTYIQRRLVFALGRFGRRVERVLVRSKIETARRAGSTNSAVLLLWCLTLRLQ